MRHPDREARSWGGFWFAKYSLYFGLPLVILIIAFHDRESWFLGLSVYWFCAIGFFAWRAMNRNVSRLWRAGLAFVMLGSWGFTIFAAYGGPGDTKVCYDRIRAATRGSASVNLGPDPNCKGIPVREIEIR